MIGIDQENGEFAVDASVDATLICPLRTRFGLFCLRLRYTIVSTKLLCPSWYLT